MIEIKAEIKKDSYRIEAKGHAKYAEYGKDIVCSACTTLFNAFHLYTEKYETESVMKSGHFVSGCERNIHTETAFYMLLKGLEFVEENYPEYVKIIK